MKGIFFNEDANHFLFEMAANGKEKITIEDNLNFIDKYKDTNVTDFFMNLGSSDPYFKAKRTYSLYDKYKDWEKAGKIDNPNNLLFKMAKLFCDMYDSGFDYRQIWIDRLKENGINPWISIRMNDIHEASDENSFLPSTFQQKHPEYKTGAYKDKLSYYDHAQNYLISDVRQFYLGIISEILDTYDVYGIELDFMREIYCFPKGLEYIGKECMNEFIHQVAALVWQCERERGHRVKIAIRVPDSIEKCMRLGYDVMNYVQSGWIDHITVTPRWSSSDGDMNVEVWTSLLKTYPVTLAAGIEILCDSCAKQDRKYINNSKENVFGYTCAYSDLGADYLYLFNYMYVFPSNDSKSIFSENNYKELLINAGDYKKSFIKKRRNPLTRNDVYAPGLSFIRKLPMDVSQNNPGDFRIPTGETFGLKTTLYIGVVPNNLDNKIFVYLNTLKYDLTKSNVKPESPAYDNLDYYKCDFISTFDSPIIVGEIFSKNDITIEWIEFEIN